MPRDIDSLADALTQAHPGLAVRRLPAADADDEEGRWSVSHPDGLTDVRIQSSTGDLPFIIESDFAEPIRVNSVASATELVPKRMGLRLGPPEGGR
jgi:hypothetical protein